MKTRVKGFCLIPSSASLISWAFSYACVPQCAKLGDILKPFTLFLNMFDPYCSRLLPVVLLKNSNFHIIRKNNNTSNYSNHSKTSEDCKVENHLNTMKNHLNHLITRKPFKKEAFVGDWRPPFWSLDFAGDLSGRVASPIRPTRREASLPATAGCIAHLPILIGLLTVTTYIQ